MYTRIKNDLKSAMMAQDKDRTGTLRMVIAALDNEAIAKGAGVKDIGLSNDDCEIVLKRMIKSRQDSIEQFTKGGAHDRALREALEIDVINAYLPKQMTEEELGMAVDAAIETLSAATIDFSLTKKHQGSIMKLLKEVHGNSFDGKMASQLVQSRLV